MSTIRIYAANVNWATSKRGVQRQLDHLLAQAVRVLVGVQEAKKVRLSRLFPSRRTRQNTSTPAKAGAGFVSKGVPLRRFRLFLAGRSAVTLPRWIARTKIGKGKTRTIVFSVHISPAYGGAAAQDRMLAKLKTRTDKLTRKGVRWVVCIDGNRPIEKIARYLDGLAYGEGIVGEIVSDNLPVLADGIDRWGKQHGLTDHPAPWIEISV